MRTITRLVLTVIVVSLPAVSLFAQSKCLSPDEAKAILEQVNSSRPAAFNKKLREELLKLTGKSEKLIYNSIEEDRTSDNSRKRIDESRQQDNARLCQVLKDFGWPTSDLVGPDGVTATLYLVRNSRQLDLQEALLPVIIAAVKKGEIEKAAVARLVDRMRVDAGMKQLFGTQVKVMNGFLVLTPIEGEPHVDDRRKQFGLPPLASHLRELERQYQTPLVKAVAPSQPLATSSNRSLERTIANELDTAVIDEDDVIRVDTNLVSLNVSVFNSKLKSFAGMLEKNDFKVFENGHEESIAYFATTDVPFDLVLLIDLSGSTSDKRDLIRKSTQRFIEAARPADRLAIVTFADATEVVCPLTADRAKLIAGANRIEGTGGTMLWDALKFTLDNVVGPRTLGRRRAIVLMTDGVDNALGGSSGGGSAISFADLLETVRKNDELLIPIYLDTESDHDFASSFRRRIYENARKTLALLAQESGGLYYTARKIEDLNGVYDQVINDLGKVYSLGYKPTNEKRDGSWRRVQIQIPNRADLSARSRPGYYAN
ncbi:MAG TPA: VWA domain-containing protein [Pyrinomonadaceae bacterium]|nr:VWA domain-containing protein [Pyrinomonadaceae bacterium]